MECDWLAPYSSSSAAAYLRMRLGKVGTRDEVDHMHGGGTPSWTLITSVWRFFCHSSRH